MKSICTPVIFFRFLVLLLGLCGARAALAEQPAMIRIDGSSTVYPITEAVAEEFGKMHREVQITVGISGTGGGFKKFCIGETEISDASRPIKAAEEEVCRSNGVQFIELPIAYDAISVVMNKRAAWLDQITTAELKKIWEPEAQGKILRWNQVNPDWPDRPLKLFGPGTDSGTFDYFTDAIVGKEGASRGDFTSSEDDNVLVQGVAGDEFALGYFGLAYFIENRDRLKALKIVKAKGAEAVDPTPENVARGSYQPLSRPLFIYVNKNAARSAEINNFVRYYLESVVELCREVGYVPLPPRAYELARRRFAALKTGSMFKGGSQVGVTVEELLSIEQGQ